MGLFKCIDGLLVGTKFLAWVIGVVGIIGSIVLFFANISLGFASAAVFISQRFSYLLLYPYCFSLKKLQKVFLQVN